MERYRIKGPEPGSRVVECWSERRLPLENLSDWQRAQKAELAHALASLESAQGEVISAIYLSPSDRDRFDAENALFYNIGTGAFGKSAVYGLKFETSIVPGPDPVGGGLRGTGLHYYRYELSAEREGLRYWRTSGEPIRIVADLDVALNSSTKPAAVWHAMKTTGRSASEGRIAPFSKFALRVTIKGRLRSANIASIIKPVFDGIISAFHRYEGSDLDLVSGRLAFRLGSTPDEIASLLLDDHLALLGNRAVIHPWGKGVKWNPQDDDCVAGALYVEGDDQRPNGYGLEIEIVPVAEGQI